MRSPGKKRFLDAVNHIESDEIPFFEVDPDIAIVNQIMDEPFPLKYHDYELPIPDYIELNKRLGNDAIYFSHIWRLGRKQKIDDEGRIHYVDGMIKTRADLDKIWFPDLDLLERRLDELCRLADREGFAVVCHIQYSPTVTSSAMGYQDYWMNTIADPGFIHEFQKIIHEWCLKELETYLKYPVDVFRLGSAFNAKTGPLCSPETLEEFETAYIHDQMEIIKANNKWMYFHIDGDVSSRIGEFIDRGVDIVNPLEPCDGRQDIYKLKELYGDRIVFHGNIDINGVLMHGTPDDVRRDVHEHIRKLARGGGYIVGSSHDIHQLIPIENLYAMRDAVHDFRWSDED